jgi:hypothetical protein
MALKMTQQRFESEQVALDAESGDHANRQIGQERVTALLLAREYVGEVYLDEPQVYGQERIADCQRSMRESGGIY